MRIVRLQPFQEMETLRRQMDRMFDELAQYNGETSPGWVPAIELHDEENHLTLRAEIPGVEGKDLDIHVTREAVSLAGERPYEKQAENKGFYHSEFRYGKFQRTVQLPVPIQNDKAQAEFKNGILTLTLPKAEELQRKVVKVNVVNS
ncbi:MULTISPECIES: Hsp20/alpha crystallin family protein [Aerosakkonema]|uniref:Hsp20/alpha crystallin family protein n=1 Tax=Aerosakkonema TaxID=1246629 RepID=UPI0035B80EC9